MPFCLGRLKLYKVVVVIVRCSSQKLLGPLDPLMRKSFFIKMELTCERSEGDRCKEEKIGGGLEGGVGGRLPVMLMKSSVDIEVDKGKSNSSRISSAFCQSF